ncbi:hypothetical protein [Sphingomonas aracearum]|uniref:Phage tail collar domain-containing protein n=1 Tax=Sphingomonas aracearum TaxID=2283317 RepID=A0A369VSN8_9SPHN|nr:hypothetical protein [Sphingomonas aracearum]RDE04685.1 hypothetical protein DVW87_13935 [Sphingomonas aracearum]
MTPLALVITLAGLQRFTAAQLDQDLDLTISSVGLTAAPFVAAPTLEVLPGEFRRINTISGSAIGDNVVHMTVRDEAEVGYSATGFGLFLADGTLFGVYGQDEAIVEKSPLTTMLVALDIAFPTGTTAELRFGDTNFLNPPATRETAGVAKIASRDQVAAGTEDHAFVTPLGLRAFLPVGVTTLWFGAANGVPSGWAICDGRKVQRSDGSGPITLPDLRDRVPVGAGGARELGEKFGGSSCTAETTNAGGHTPTGRTDSATTGVTVSAPVSNQTAGGGSGKSVTSASLQDPGHAHPVTIDAVPDHRHSVTLDVTQPSLALFFIMRI